MTEPLAWALAFGAGAALGAAYFTLLWHAVRSLTQGARAWPVAVFGFRTALRIGVLCAGLGAAIMLEATLGDIALAGLGFVAARFLVVAAVRRQGRGGA